MHHRHAAQHHEQQATGACVDNPFFPKTQICGVCSGCHQQWPGCPCCNAAVFLLPNGRQRTVRFGTASNYVSNPRKTARDRAAYIARHRVNENHGDPLTPGALSRWLLWGESRSLARNTAAFRRRFRLQ